MAYEQLVRVSVLVYIAHIVEPAGPSTRRIRRTRTRTTTTKTTITRASVAFACLYVVFFFPLPFPFIFSSVPFLLFDPLDPEIIGKILYFAIFLFFYDPGFFADLFCFIYFFFLILPISAFYLSIFSEI